MVDQRNNMIDQLRDIIERAKHAETMRDWHASAHANRNSIAADEYDKITEQMFVKVVMLAWARGITKVLENDILP